MSDKPKNLSPMQQAFRQAGKSVCNRYAVLKDVPPVQKVAPVEQNKEVEQNDNEEKSFTQVETCVEQGSVRQRSCGLKPEESKPFRLAVRLSEAEREIVVRRAQQAGLTLSKYFRAAILGPDYVAKTDPAKRELLRSIGRELGRQGNNLNQIAHHLNGGVLNPHEGKSMLSLLARSLLDAHRAVRRALTDGMEAE